MKQSINGIFINAHTGSVSRIRVKPESELLYYLSKHTGLEMVDEVEAIDIGGGNIMYIDKHGTEHNNSVFSFRGVRIAGSGVIVGNNNTDVVRLDADTIHRHLNFYGRLSTRDNVFPKPFFKIPKEDELEENPNI